MNKNPIRVLERLTEGTYGVYFTPETVAGKAYLHHSAGDARRVARHLERGVAGGAARRQVVSDGAGFVFAYRSTHVPEGEPPTGIMRYAGSEPLEREYGLRAVLHIVRRSGGGTMRAIKRKYHRKAGAGGRVTWNAIQHVRELARRGLVRVEREEHRWGGKGKILAVYPL